MAKSQIRPSPTMGNPVIPKPTADSSAVPVIGLHQHLIPKLDTTKIVLPVKVPKP